jgi:predicted transcriptional regulator
VNDLIGALDICESTTTMRVKALYWKGLITRKRVAGKPPTGFSYGYSVTPNQYAAYLNELAYGEKTRNVQS